MNTSRRRVLVINGILLRFGDFLIGESRVLAVWLRGWSFQLGLAGFVNLGSGVYGL